ncbi:MAG: TRAP transporter small permease subunit [Nitrincola lacisaponensis]|uniref:TRAP transporter small permease subunit n=1 Tax=Nitrincola lacisaponensis TaxID=267850 RepID=UPI00391886B7
MKIFIRFANLLSISLGWIARPVLIALVISMLYEVFVRFFLNAPTKWAFDISYMLNGSIFILGAGYALYHNDHVKIDFLSTKIPPKIKCYIDIVLYGLMLSPVIAGLSWVAIQRAIRAFERGEVEAVSPWAPLMWPFYSIIAIGLLVLFIQCLAVVARCYLDINKSKDTLQE